MALKLNTNLCKSDFLTIERENAAVTSGIKGILNFREE